MRHRFHIKVEGHPELSGDNELERDYREGDLLVLDGVRLRVRLRAEDAADAIDRPFLYCVPEGEG